MKNKEFEKKLLKKYELENIENISSEKIEIIVGEKENKKIISFLNKQFKQFNLKCPTYKELFSMAVINEKDFYSCVNDIERGKVIFLISDDMERYIKLRKLSHLFFVPEEYDNISKDELIDGIKKFNFSSQLKYNIFYFLFLLFVVPFIFVFLIIKSFLEIKIQEILYFLKIKKRGLYRWSPTSAYWGDYVEFIEKTEEESSNKNKRENLLLR